MGETQRYTIAEEASTTERDAVCRAVLRVVWSHLAWFDIDLAGLGVDASTTAAVARLQQFRTRTMLGLGRRFTTTAHLVPGRDDSVLDAVLEVAGKTIGSIGLTNDAEVVYDANDGGTSCLFDLTDRQREGIAGALADEGLSERLLVSWRH